MGESFVLNPLDLIIAAIIGFGMWKGAKQGFMKGASRFISIILAAILGFRLRRVAVMIYLDYLNVQWAPEMIGFVSFATAFVVVFIISYTLVGQFSSILGKMKIGMDQALGALFGGVGATLVLSLAFILLSYVNFPTVDNARGSVLYPQVKNFSRYALGFSVEILREANEQINRYGIGGYPNPGNNNPPPASQQPVNSKPKAIR